MCPLAKIKKETYYGSSDDKCYEFKVGRTVMEDSIFNEILTEGV